MFSHYKKLQPPSFWWKISALILVVLLVFSGLALSGKGVAAEVSLGQLKFSWDSLHLQQGAEGNLPQSGSHGMTATGRPYASYPKGPPVLPSAFWGAVTVNGAAVPTGTVVTAWISGTQVAQTTILLNNGVSVYALDIPGDNPDTPAREGGNEGEEVRFKIGPIWAKEHTVWQSGNLTSQNLSADGYASPAVLWLPKYGYSAGGWTSQDKYPRMLADVNGDGKADILGFSSIGAYVSLSTGKGFSSPARWIAAYGYSAGGWTSQDKYPRMLADVNGDGKADIVGFASGGVYVSLSTGSSFAMPSRWSDNFGVNAGWTSQNQYPRMLADMNGDRKADIVGFNGTGVLVSLSTGSSFGAALVWSQEFGANTASWSTQNQYPRAVADLNGDRKADIAGFGSDGVYVSLTLSSLAGSSKPGITELLDEETLFSEEATLSILPDETVPDAGFTAWRGEYFANSALAGEPVLVREDQGVSFDWGEEAPDPSLPTDAFSVRWTCVLPFEEGSYIIHLLADDGARLFLDGQLVIDQWVGREATELAVPIQLAGGEHTLVLEYFEDHGNALVDLWWEQAEPMQEEIRSGFSGNPPPPPMPAQ